MIDAYTHCGISKYQPIESVSEVMRLAGVQRAVLVQHLGHYDNRYIEEIVAEDSYRFAGVALVDGSDPSWPDAVADVATSPSFGAIRLTDDSLHVNPELPIAACELGLNLVLYLPNGMKKILPEIVRLAGAVGDSKLIITHLGCPQVVGSKMVAGWETLDLAYLPNVMITLSGQGMHCPRPHHPLAEFITQAIEAFTTERMMWGSNYPVCGGPEEYASDLQLVLRGGWGLSSQQITEVTEGTASSVFFTSTAPSRR